MSTLSKEYRRQLERAVLNAREEAERGAAAALEGLGLTETKIPPHLNDEQQKFRRRLRAHGKQVGDTQISDKTWDISHLIHECAYEHWHRMLFARFLAENGFLIEPDSGLDVDLDFCEERARELKTDKWEVAAGFAQRMLPGIFRPDDPVLQLRLPVESRNRLTALLASLPRDVFLADDSLGWVYQFWQAKKKDEVNESGEKIGADQLAAVTQLFTEDYMVEFLLHNTLGAWWTAKRRAEGKSQPIPFAYLRLNEDGTPAAGAFEGWPKLVKQLRVLDPCMGSGHFPVFALVILVRMRMEEEGLSARDACVAVLRDNLFGLELDPRCTQIAAFNLALAAWKLGGHHAELPLNLACSGLGLHAKKEDWVKLAEGNPNLHFAMGALYDLFQKAPVLGSLINPRRDKTVTYSATLPELQPLLAKALQRETGDEAHELAVTAQGVAKAAEILAGQFTLVATNVPYLGRGKQDEVLMDYCERVHPTAKPDLATCFVERCLDFCVPSGSTALVTPQNWLFLGQYKKFRETLLATVSWRTVTRLGARAFETITGEVVNVSLLVHTKQRPTQIDTFLGIDVSDSEDSQAKRAGLLGEPVLLVNQLSQLKNPDARIIQREGGTDLQMLSERAVAYQGLVTGDRNAYIFQFWEIPALVKEWETFADAYSGEGKILGRENIIFWEQGRGRLYKMASENRDRLHDMHESGNLCWGKKGILLTRIGLRATPYYGERYDNNLICIIPFKESDLAALWNFCRSGDYQDAVRELDQKLSLTNATACKVGVTLDEWIGSNEFPKAFSSDPKQWVFSGHPKGSDHPLQVAVARLVGYRWPRQTGSSFPDCSALGADGLEKHADNDGVVCFPQLRDEPPAATRLRALLADAYGAEWGHALERKLIAATGSDAESLEEWLVDDFFAQHCDLFYNRPLVWHLWDGRKDGFNVLVNYHKLAGPDGVGARTLETLAYAYLGDWIGRQKDAVAHGEAGADDRLAVALELQGELKKISAGEPPYDLFVRWKPLHQQPLGWQPDINDGVRLNIRPFLVASLSRGKKGAGALRGKLNVKWEKDRGKEPPRSKEDFPWFWKWDEQTPDFAGNSEFDGNRWTDCHYTTAFKKAARDRKAKK